MRPHQGPGHGFGALEIKSAVTELVVTESMLGELLGQVPVISADIDRGIES